jgi:hypothetical protein
VDNQFAVRATGGVGIVLGVDGSGKPMWTCSVVNGGSWACSSDRTFKTTFVSVDARDVLQRLRVIPLSTWSAKDNPDGARHLGPMAQDFHAAFGLGEGDKAIATIDLDGVQLASIQGLAQIARMMLLAITRFKLVVCIAPSDYMCYAVVTRES